MRLRPQTIAFALGVLLTTTLFAEWIARLEIRHDYVRAHALVSAQADGVRARLHAELVQLASQTQLFVTAVAANPRLGRPQFERLAADLAAAVPTVRTVSLARGDVATFIYPAAGNEAALGLRYMEIPEQRDAMQRVMAARTTILTGPQPLANGGLALVSRTPIFVRAARDTDRYWGIASLTLDAPSLYARAGLNGVAETRFALRTTEGHGAAGVPLFGEVAIFAADPVRLALPVPGGEWQLAALPAAGWPDEGAANSVYRLIGYSLAVLFSTLVAVLLFERERSDELALHDPLTGLPNRLFFDLRLDHEVDRAQRHHQSFALLYVDLDDFKPVNDLHGHKAGDRVLLETGRRLRATLRRVDTVARLGGDEFMVILGDVAAHEEAVKVAEKLIESLSKPIALPEAVVVVGASVGISFYPTDGRTADELIRRADRAMYAAKGEGKNRSVCAESIAVAIA